MCEVPPRVRELVSRAARITVITGAGMSAESGVPTFRDAQVGLWAQYDPMTLASPQAWAQDPELVWAWYQKRCAMVRAVEPNAGHRALAELARSTRISIVTQNVDDLHERAGSTGVVHLHGSLFAPHCDGCRVGHWVAAATQPNAERLMPPSCICGGLIRPGVVWFGEELPQAEWSRALTLTLTADLVVVVGTSGIVYPAAELPQIAMGRSIPVIEINPVHTQLSEWADVWWEATAATALPALVQAAAAVKAPTA